MAGSFVEILAADVPSVVGSLDLKLVVWCVTKEGGVHTNNEWALDGEMVSLVD